MRCWKKPQSPKDHLRGQQRHLRQSTPLRSSCSITPNTPDTLSTKLRSHSCRTTSPTSAEATTPTQSSQPVLVRTLGSSQVRTEQKATKVLGVVFFVFIICWVPFFTHNLLAGLQPSLVKQIPEWIVSAFQWLGYVSSTLNPIIYTIFNRNFRRTFRRLLTCKTNTRRRRSERVRRWSPTLASSGPPSVGTMTAIPNASRRTRSLYRSSRTINDEQTGIRSCSTGSSTDWTAGEMNDGDREKRDENIHLEAFGRHSKSRPKVRSLANQVLREMEEDATGNGRDTSENFPQSFKDVKITITKATSDKKACPLDQSEVNNNHLKNSV